MPELNSIVAKENSLVSKMAMFSLSELRLIAFCLAHYDSRTDNNRMFTARISDLAKIFPSMDNKSAYALVRQTMLRINQKPLEFEEEGVKYFWNWFSGFAYREGAGEFKFCITEEIKPYLMQLKGNFTQYRLEDVYQFKSQNTWKLYENLKQRLNMKRWSVSLDELKQLLGLLGKYQKWYDLRKTVLEPSIAEINDLSDIEVSYEKEKYGRSISGVVFFIDSKQPEETITLENEKDVLYKALLDYGINSKVALQYSREAEEADKTAYIIERLPKIKARWDKKKEGNLQQYVLGALQQEIRQGSLLNYAPEQPKKLDHTEAWECLQNKKNLGEKCAVRERGIPGQRKRCKICLDKLPVSEFGV